MLSNKTPWLEELKNNHIVSSVENDIQTDICIVGAGISGISTAYYILKNTNFNVIILDAKKIARGATGHNAGHINPLFEKSFFEIVEEFGIEKAMYAQREFIKTFQRISDIYKTIDTDMKFSMLDMKEGLTTKEQIISNLELIKLWLENGFIYLEITLSDDLSYISELKYKYPGMIKLARHKDILNCLETKNEQFIGYISFFSGIMNSALFCEEIIAYLQHQFDKRFRLFENSKISEIYLYDRFGKTYVNNFEIKYKHVVLCTNGFENIKLIDPLNTDINNKFHKSIYGIKQHMIGFVDNDTSKLDFAASYFTPDNKLGSESYLYMTRRNLGNKTLSCFGGLDNIMYQDRDIYVSEDNSDIVALEMIKNKIKLTNNLSHREFFDYHWHGLMGYTQNKIRLIGYEKANHTLLYNLGCNGIGIIPAVYGGDRISKLLLDVNLDDDLFTPV